MRRLTPLRRVLLLCLVLPALAWMTAATTAALASDPSAPPTADCRDRFATPGPGGIDLALACTANELVGAFSELAGPARTSTTLVIAAIAALAIGLFVLSFVGRLAARRAARRLAPATPTAWWVCPVCRSFNPPAAGACYGCTAPRTDDARVAPTAGEPQSGP